MSFHDNRTPGERARGRLPNGGKAVGKAFFTNLSTGDEIPVQFNPTEFSKTLEVEYARQTVPGLSHKVLQYVGTSNTQIELELYFIADSVEQMKANIKTRSAIEALCYPRSATSVADGGPPRVLFVWPRFATMTMVITGMTDTFTLFERYGRPREMTISLALEEVRNMRLLSSDVAEHGLERSHSGGTDEFNDFESVEAGENGWE